MKKYIRIIGLFLVLIIMGVAYASINKNNKQDINLHEETNISMPSIAKNQSLTNWKFKDENGKIFSLEELKGKVVFINLWATWCPPCIAEMPSIDQLKKTFKDRDDLVFLMVDVDNNIEKAREWMKNKNIDLPVHVSYTDIPRDIFQGSIPTTIIIDKKGNIAQRKLGASDYMSPDIIDSMKNLLNEK
ncbi:TlpA disulfide reductase family protein [Myroides odoratimimus]|uniref:TlpA family protein disulfide reductase n=1 Tax=Myroides odoratimimus TaxID=76832 RepID=UPI003100E050